MSHKKPDAEPRAVATGCWAPGWNGAVEWP